MLVSPSVDEMREVQEEQNLPHLALVEKDFFVVQVLRILNQFTQPESRPMLVFGGGTALCRAHRLIERMSEDIDLKMISEPALTGVERTGFRENVIARLLEAGFEFSTDTNVRVMDSGRTFVINLPYASKAPEVGSLRAEIKIEVSSWPRYGESVKLPIQSFMQQAIGGNPEIESFPCAPVFETAAEKFVALTRRIGEERAAGPIRDATILRHAHDFHRVHGNHEIEKTIEVIKIIIESDRNTRGNRFPAYREDPYREIFNSLDVLRNEDEYKSAYNIFQRDMVYGELASFEDCMNTLCEYRKILERVRA